MPTPYTKQEILDIFKSVADNGKLSLENLAKIVFDSHFPDDLFPRAAAVIQQASTDPKRSRELALFLIEKSKEMVAIQEQVIEVVGRGDFVTARHLKDRISEIELEIAPLEQEFFEIKKRMDGSEND